MNKQERALFNSYIEEVIKGAVTPSQIFDKVNVLMTHLEINEGNSEDPFLQGVVHFGGYSQSNGSNLQRGFAG